VSGERVVIGNAELWHGDCREILPGLKDLAFDLACVDPPYFDGPNKSGYYGKGFSNIGVQRAKHYDTLESWDVPSPEYFTELSRVSRHQIIWGANHFCDRFKANGSGWIVWDKLNGARPFAFFAMFGTECTKASTAGICR
jgi:site-specific DNA-methyltransferase (adenine-specific)